MNTFRSIRALAPVVRVGEEHSEWCFFALSVGFGEYFVFRDVFAHNEMLDVQKPIPVPDAIGVRGLFRCIVERRIALPRNPTDFPVRLPSFSNWWDGTDKELFAIMFLLTTSSHEVEDTLENAARAIKTAELADRVIADDRFPVRTHFAALRATETETGVSIERLCTYINAHGGFAMELYKRLTHADPLIELLMRRGELERIRPAIEQVPKAFEWWNGYSGRPHILEAVRILTGVTR